MGICAFYYYLLQKANFEERERAWRQALFRLNWSVEIIYKIVLNLKCNPLNFGVYRKTS